MRKNIFLKTILASLLTAGLGLTVVSCSDDTSKHPAGKVKTEVGSDTISLSNKLLSATFNWKDGKIEFGGFKGLDGTELLQGGGPIFTLSLANGTELSSTTMTATKPELVELAADEKALRKSSLLPGQAITATFTAPDNSFTIEWKAVLRDNSHYIRQEFTLLRPRYHVDFRGWEVRGNLMGWDYQVVQNDRPVLTISKQLFRMTDAYVLDYANPADEIPALLLVLAIDAANCRKD